MQLGTQLPPPSSMAFGCSAFKIIGLPHLYLDQNHITRSLPLDLIVLKTVKVLRVVDDKCPPRNVEEKSLPLPEEFQPGRKFPVKFMQCLPGLGYIEPDLPQVVDLYDGDDGGSNS